MTSTWRLVIVTCLGWARHAPLIYALSPTTSICRSPSRVPRRQIGALASFTLPGRPGSGFAAFTDSLRLGCQSLNRTGKHTVRFMSARLMQIPVQTQLLAHATDPQRLLAVPSWCQEVL